GHAIQILKRYYEEFNRSSAKGLAPEAANQEAVIESIQRVGPVMLTTGLIAIISFFSLCVNGIPMVQHFGFFAGFGVLSAMFLELTFIPALRSFLKAPKMKEVSREKKYGKLDQFLSSLADNLVGGRAPWLVGGGLVLVTAMALGILFVKVENNFLLYFKPSSEVRVMDKAINEKFAGTNNIQFLVKTSEKDGIKDPAVLKGMEKLQAFMDAQPLVGKTQSLVDSIKRMNQAMHADKPAFNSVPDNRNLVAQYLLLYSLSGDPSDFDTFVDNDYQRAVIRVYLKTNSASYAEALNDKAQAVIASSFPPGTTVSLGGGLAQVVVLNNSVVHDKIRNMIQMAFIVFFLAAIVLRSFVGGLFVLTPLIAVISANFGIMGWLGIPIDISAVTVAAMAIGVGSDYEIYLLFRFREELKRSGSVLTATRESLMTSGKAIIFVALSVIGGYGVLQTSGFAFYVNLSTLVTTTMTISALFALFFLRALMMVFKPKFIFGNNPEIYFNKTQGVEK
ncbi:MAG TPA: MMPL family transporter, partial [bacterium]|nr:MMPL family transporter [bacterium]